MTMNDHKIIWSTFIKKFTGKTCKDIGLSDNESIISFDFFNFELDDAILTNQNRGQGPFFDLGQYLSAR